MNIKQKFGLAVRKRRKELDISQEELAMRMNSIDSHGDEKAKYADQSYVSRIELGQANVTLETIAVISDALQLEPGRLFSSET